MLRMIGRLDVGDFAGRGIGGRRGQGGNRNGLDCHGLDQDFLDRGFRR